MSTFIDRLIQEHYDLGVKLDKLEEFIVSDKWHDVDEIQKSLLKIQLNAMNTYYTCISERIDFLQH